jgi:uracil-DNA glycosylase family 4
MDPSPRDEVIQLLRDLGAQLVWQRDAGLIDAPSRGPLPTVAPIVAEPATPPVASSPAPVVVSPAPTPTVAEPAPVAEVAAAVGDGPVPAGRAGALKVIQEEVAVCRSCKLAPTRTQTVFARGNPEARLMFIGEGPGADEDRTGLPFVGVAGQLLDKIIAAMKLSEEQVYIANIVKCRPPSNRVPEQEEMKACTPFLLRQIEVVKPDVIVALGKTAASYLLDSKGSMTSLRGRWHSWNGVAVMPTWHPSYVLRVRDLPNSTARAEVWTDMKLVLERLGLPVPAPRG